MRSLESRRHCCSLANSDVHGPPNGGRAPRPIPFYKHDPPTKAEYRPGTDNVNARAINMALPRKAERLTTFAINMFLLVGGRTSGLRLEH